MNREKPSVTSIDGVACGVSRGRVSDFLRVMRSGSQLAIAMADGHTCGWDSGQVSLSAPVLDAIVGQLIPRSMSPYRSGPGSSTGELFDAARRAFVAAAEAHPDDALAGGPATQLTLVEIDGRTLRATWLATMELSVFRGRMVQRVTLDMSPAIAREVHAPSTIELALQAGDLVTLSCRRYVGTQLDHARSDLLTSHATYGPTPETLVTDVLYKWRDVEAGLQSEGSLIGHFNLTLAAVRV